MFKMATSMVWKFRCILPLQRIVMQNRFFTTSSIQGFRITDCLSAEPPKKKKKLDLTRLIEERERRKKKKMQKIMEKLGPAELKPIEEFKVEKKLLENSRQRKVPSIPFEESERRAILQKEWSRYKYQEHLEELRMVARVKTAQEKALTELKSESEELYELAIQCDNRLFELELTGPVDTPPIGEYDTPEGEYVDISREL